MITVNCGQCGNDFKTYPSRAKSGRRFCSMKCYRLHKAAKHTVVCKGCGEEFEVWESRLSENGNFCSRECFVKLRSASAVTVACRQCGESFRVVFSVVERGSGVFCSRPCLAQWRSVHKAGENSTEWQARAVTICKGCGGEFDILPSVVQGGKRGKFCSKMCYHEHATGGNHHGWKGGMVIVECEQCGGQFQARPSRIEKGWGRFCSMKCFGAWNTGANSPNWQGGPVTVVCKQCKQTFAVKPSAAKRGGVFCSLVCHGRWQSENATGKDSPNWQGGKSFEPYPVTFNNAFKRKIRERDGRTCVICKMTGKCVHHINYVKDDTTSENCITLCRSCHGATGANRGYWQGALEQIVTRRGYKDCLNQKTVAIKEMGER